MNRRQFINLSGLTGFSLVVSIDFSGKIVSCFPTARKGVNGVSLEKMLSDSGITWSNPDTPNIEGKLAQTKQVLAQLFKTASGEEVTYTPPIGSEHTVRTNMDGANDQKDAGLFHEYLVQCDSGYKPELTFTLSGDNPIPAYSSQATGNPNEYLVRMIAPTDGNDISEDLTVYFGQIPTPIDNRDDPVQLPQSISLSQNYPNPFNNTTTIPYQVNRPTDIKIEVYDTAGRRVTTLFDGKKMPGNHSETWNGTDSNGNTVSSGVYMLKVTSPDHTITKPYVKKMVMVK